MAHEFLGAPAVTTSGRLSSTLAIDGWDSSAAWVDSWASSVRLQPAGIRAGGPYLTADIAAQISLAQAVLATALVPAVPGIRTSRSPIILSVASGSRPPARPAPSPTTKALGAALQPPRPA